MLKIESNLKINGRHWGLAFTDGIAHTANVSLATKLLLKGYVVTDEPVQPETDSQPEAVQMPAITPVEITATELTETPKPKTTKPRKKAVTADAADESGV
jgi:hypothetical protein